MSPAAELQRPLDNFVLSSLPDDEYARLAPHLTHAALALGQTIHEPGSRLEYVYFPTSSVISFLYTTREGSTAEMGMAGNDGVVGVALILGGETMANRAVVQVGGDAWRMKSELVREEFARAGPLQSLLLRYTQALMTQIAQTAVCNRLHSVEKRFCRWLLLTHDRVRSDELLMTQEFIANMLGGRRESVTVAARHLQNEGWIDYSRGHIRILNRSALEDCVCECYGSVRTEVQRLFAGPLTTPVALERASFWKV